MPQPRKNQISLMDTLITIVFPAVFVGHLWHHLETLPDDIGPVLIHG